MFTTKEQISQFTGYDVTTEVAWQAQTMIEIFIGRTEADVDDARDIQLLARAVAFQAAYIQQNPEIAFEQAAVSKLTVSEYSTQFDTTRFSPFISPWAEQACRRLSWFRTRSVHTGSMNRAESDAVPVAVTPEEGWETE